MSADGKQIINSLYHGAVLVALSTEYAMLSKAIFKGAVPKLDLDVKSIGMLAIDVTATAATKDMRGKEGIIPADIMK